jgi:SnoaL-like domain
MLRWEVGLMSFFAVGIFLTTAGAQQNVASKSTMTLTAQDHIDIQQLVARYSHALDSAADNGNALAALFTADGSLAPAEDGRTYAGQLNLAAYARANAPGQIGRANVRHFSYKASLEPSSGGATGRTLVTFATIGKAGEQATALNGGQYWDEFVKTPAGWRIQKRTFVPGGRPNSRAAAPPSR